MTGDVWGKRGLQLQHIIYIYGLYMCVYYIYIYHIYI